MKIDHFGVGLNFLNLIVIFLLVYYSLVILLHLQHTFLSNLLTVKTLKKLVELSIIVRVKQTKDNNIKNIYKVLNHLMLQTTKL